MKTALAALTFGILLATAVGCGSNADDEPSTDELTTVHIAISSPQVEHSLPVVAQELGIFEKHGIKADVELVPAGAPTVIAGLVGGSVDMGIFAGPGLEQGVLQGANLKYVGVWVHRAGGRFVGGPGIDSVEDLKGQSVAIPTPGGFSDMFTTIALREAGLDPNKDIVRRNLNGQGPAMNALVSGQAKAALLGHGQAFTILDQLEGSKILVDFSKEDDYPWTGAGIVATDSYIAEDAEPVQNVIAALQEAAEVYQDPAQAEKIADLLTKFLQLDKSIVLQVLDVVRPLIDPTLVPRPADHEHVLEQIAVTEPAAKKAAASDMFDPSFTEDDK